MRLAWTGHRPDVFADAAAAQRTVRREALQLIAAGATEFRVGGQRGVDLWAGEVALEAGLPVVLVLPTPPATFTRDWSPVDANRLEALLRRAQVVSIADPGETQGALAYDRRNELVVGPADLLLAVWTGLRRGGTFYTVCAAQSAGVPWRELRLPGAPSPAPGRGL